jgi:hypothetical protein
MTIVVPAVALEW